MVNGLPDGVIDDVVLEVPVNSVEMLLDCAVGCVCVGVLKISVGGLPNDVGDGVPDDAVDVPVAVVDCVLDGVADGVTDGAVDVPVAVMDGVLDDVTD